MTSETPVYVPGYGEMTAGQVAEAIRAEEKPAVDAEHDATVDMWVEICTRNLCRPPWENSGATPSGRRA